MPNAKILALGSYCRGEKTYFTLHLQTTDDSALAEQLIDSREWDLLYDVVHTFDDVLQFALGFQITHPDGRTMRIVPVAATENPEAFDTGVRAANALS